MDHLVTDGESYDAVAFVTYLYATTAEGLPRIAERALLVPTVHDEPPLRLHIFDQVFALPRLLLFSTPEEQQLADARFGVDESRARLVGIGVDDPPPSDPARFAVESGVDRPYVLCVGRLDASKGVLDLVDAHARYRAAQPDGLDLVLLGRRRARAARARVVAPARFRARAAQARRAKRGGRRRLALAVREPVALAARGMEPWTPDAGKRGLAGTRRPVAPVRRGALVPRRPRVRLDARLP